MGTGWAKTLEQADFEKWASSLCTQNEFVASTVIGNLNIFTEVSFPMQAVVVNLLADVCGRISCFLVKGFLCGGDELLDRDNQHSRGIAHLICSCSTSGYICLLWFFIHVAKSATQSIVAGRRFLRHINSKSAFISLTRSSDGEKQFAASVVIQHEGGSCCDADSGSKSTRS